jgi:hypothetical protein
MMFILHNGVDVMTKATKRRTEPKQSAQLAQEQTVVCDSLAADITLLGMAINVIYMERADLEGRVMQLANMPCAAYGVDKGGMLRASVEELEGIAERCALIAKQAATRMVAVAAVATKAA